MTHRPKAHIHCPHIALPGREVSLDEVLKLAAEYHPAGELDEKTARVMRNTEVRTRHFIRPPEEVFAHGTEPSDWPDTVGALAELAAEAGAAALERARIAPEEIDALVVTSVTGYVMPGIDAMLVDALGLDRRVRRIPMAQIGCVGGLYGLIVARDLLEDADSRVLVVGAESFSTAVQPTADGFDAMIYKALAGDGAAAAVVTGRPPEPGTDFVVLDDPLQYLISGTRTELRLTADPAGRFGFGSTGAAPQAVTKAAGVLAGWLAGRDPGFVVAHHGGPAILANIEDVLGIDDAALRHSRESMRRTGNMISASFHDILRRTLIERGPAAARGEGTALALGPGMTLVAARLHRPGEPSGDARRHEKAGY